MKFREGKLKIRESILLSIGVVVLGVGFQKLWVAPNSQRLDELAQRTEAAKKKIEDTQALIVKVRNRAPASIPVKTDDHTTKSLLEKYVGSNDRFSKVIMGVVSGSKEGSFSISKIAAEKSVKVGIYTQTTYEIEAESSFLSIGKFLETLEDSPLLTEVDSIEISRIEEEMRKCTAKIRLFGYVGEGR
ncbi:MAG: hypothetical protein EBX52_06375 [Proteobacteria bacterium]|nr:hypothetical protein [Pseudomonadota bacterium]